MNRIEVLKGLLKLQDYQLIIKESEIVHNKKMKEDTVAVEDRIRLIREQLDDDILKIYDTSGLNREINNCCNGCYIKIPKGDIARFIKNEEKIPVCSFCHSLLYLESFDK